MNSITDYIEINIIGCRYNELSLLYDGNVRICMWDLTVCLILYYYLHLHDRTNVYLIIRKATFWQFQQWMVGVGWPWWKLLLVQENKTAQVTKVLSSIDLNNVTYLRLYKYQRKIEKFNEGNPWFSELLRTRGNVELKPLNIL